jgi:hypothetical protein
MEFIREAIVSSWDEILAIPSALFSAVNLSLVSTNEEEEYYTEMRCKANFKASR